MKNLGTPASCCCALATLGFLRHIGSVPKRWMTEEELESCESCSVDCYPNDLQCWIKSTGILPIYKCWRQFIQGATVPINVFASCDHVKQHGMKSSSRVSKADDECSTAIQPSFWYEKEPRKNPDIFAANLCYTKKKHPTTLLGPLSTETVRNGGFLFAWEKVTWGWCHYVHPQVGPNMNFSRRCASLWRKAAKCYFVLVLSSCGLFQKSHLVTGFFSQPFLRCVKILHGCTSHTFPAKHTTRILSNHIQDPVQADSKNKFWESCNKNCWVISWYQLPSKPSPSLKDQIHAKK